MAGLTYYYDRMSHYYAYLTRDEDKGRVLSLIHMNLGKFSQPIGVGITVPDGEVYLRLETRTTEAQFYYSFDGSTFYPLGEILDATVLSDDYYEIHGKVNRFTGAFIGICCQDLSGSGKKHFLISFIIMNIN